MRRALKVFCWMTLYADLCVSLGSVFQGAFGNGFPSAEIRFGEFSVTSAMPGGATFIIWLAVWTDVLAGAVLYLLRQGSAVQPRKPAQSPNDGRAEAGSGSMGSAARG